jgi:hypothetical protein
MQSRKDEESSKQGHVIILKDGNYAQWSAVMKRILIKKSLWYTINELVKSQHDCNSKEDKLNQKLINESFEKAALVKAFDKIKIQRLLDDKKEPEGDARETLMKWRYKKDGDEVLAVIITACDEINVARIKDIEEPSFVWNRLAEIHCNRTNENVSNLLAEIRDRHQDGEMQPYITAQKATFVAYQLAGGSMTEHAFCLMLVRNLSQDFDVQAGLLSASADLKVSSVEIALKTAYATFLHRKAHRKKPPARQENPVNEMNAAIHLAVAKALKGKQGKKPFKNKQGKGICYHFANHGNCRWGDKCKWKHVSDDESKSKSKTKKQGHSSSSDSDSDE